MEVISTDMRLEQDDPNREVIEVLPAGMTCLDPDSEEKLTVAALECESELKKLRRTCKKN